jgi:hypothetical protein
MATAESWLRREQQAKADFVHWARHIREATAASELSGGVEAVEALTSATIRFGHCELRMRSAERIKATKSTAASAKSLEADALDANQQGLTALAAVRPVVDEIKNVKGDADAASRWKAESAAIRRRWREEVADLDVGGADAKHLVGLMDECLDALDKHGPPALGQYLSDRIDELQKERKSADRGTRQASFPWWKIVAVAIWLGITAFAIWRAITYGAAWWDVAMIAFIALIGTLLLALGC